MAANDKSSFQKAASPRRAAMIVFASSADVVALCQSSAVCPVSDFKSPTPATEKSGTLSRGSKTGSGASRRVECRGASTTEWVFAPLPSASQPASAANPMLKPLSATLRAAAQLSELLRQQTTSLPRTLEAGHLGRSAQLDEKQAAANFKRSSLCYAYTAEGKHYQKQNGEAKRSTFLWSVDGATTECKLPEKHGEMTDTHRPVDLICIDVEGVYTLQSAPAPTTSTFKAATTKPQQKTTPEASLSSLLHQRFASARSSCPLCDTAGSALALSEAWVVPLPEEAMESKSQKAGYLPMECFPRLVRASSDARTRARGAAPASQASSAAPLSLLRIHQYAPDLTLLLSQSTAGPTEGVSRKRQRDDANINEDGAEGSQAGGRLHLSDAAGGVVRLRVLQSSYLSHSCYFSTWCCRQDFDITARYRGGVETPARVEDDGACHLFYASLQRALEKRSSLLHNSWAAVWMGKSPAALCGVGRPQYTISHGRGALTADALLQKSSSVLKEEGRCAASSANAAADNASPAAADDLFEDVAEQFSETPGSPGATCDAKAFQPSKTAASDAGLSVWSVDVLWGLWRRLGWMPPDAAGAFAVQLQGHSAPSRPSCPSFDMYHHLNNGKSLRSSSSLLRHMSAAEWLRFTARCMHLMDAAYVSERLASINTPAGQKSMGVDIQNNVSNEEDEEEEKLDSELADGKVDALDASVSDSAAQLLHSKRETFHTLRRTLSLHSALLQQGGMPHSAARCPARDVDDVDSGTFNVLGCLISPAARALASDITATTINTAVFPAVKAQAGQWNAFVAAQPIFSMSWAGHVLEPPAVIFTGPAANEMNAQDRPGDVWGEFGVSMTALLHQQPAPLDSGLLAETASAASAARLSGGTGARLVMKSEDGEEAGDACCEVSDIAELRWRDRANAWCCTTGSPLLSQHCPCSRTTRAKSCNKLPCQCSCCVAVEKVVGSTAEGPETVALRTIIGEATFASSDPLSKWLTDMFVDFARRHSALKATAEVDNAAGTAMSFSVDAAKVASGGEPSVLLDREQLSSLLTSTIVRVVQQNKGVVRRLMQVLESYQIMASAQKSTDSCDNSCAGSAQQFSTETCAGDAVVAKQADKETLVRNVWQCLTSAGAPEAQAAPASDVQQASKALALRQLRGFWSTVASVTRESMQRKLAQLASAQLSSTETVGARMETQTGDGDADAALPTSADSLGKEKSSLFENANKCAGSPSVNAFYAGHAALGGASAATQCAREVRELSGEGVSYCAPSPLSSMTSAAELEVVNKHVTHVDYADWQQIVNGLDGQHAMQLYMQHVLQCTAGASISSRAQPPSGNTATQGYRDSQSGSIERNEETLRADPELLQRTEVEKAHDDQRRSGVVPSVAASLTLHPWLQHALFLLSYGLSSPALSTTAPLTVKPLTRNESRSSRPGTSSVSGVSTDAEVCADVSVLSPRLAQFRMLRGGKLTLDAWIGAALEVYASRWSRAAQECPT